MPPDRLTRAAFRRLLDLGRAASRRGTGLLLVDGPHLVEEALAAGRLREVVRTDAFAAEETGAALLARIRAAGLREFSVPEAEIQRIAGVRTSPGVAGVAATFVASLDPVLRKTPCRVVLLDGVSDPGNAGSVLRTALALGFEAAIVAAGSADPTSMKVVRASAGAVFHLPVEQGGAADAETRRLRGLGFHAFVGVVHGGEDYRAVDYGRRFVLVVGNEGAGSALAAGDLARPVSIPMAPGTESLNVAAAAAILLARAAAV